jgi:hypothetical protein
MIRIEDASQLAGWRKSTYSDNNGGSCVEVLDGLPVTPVCDSKNMTGPAVVFGNSAWAAFVESVK